MADHLLTFSYRGSPYEEGTERAEKATVPAPVKIVTEEVPTKRELKVLNIDIRLVTTNKLQRKSLRRGN